MQFWTTDQYTLFVDGVEIGSGPGYGLSIFGNRLILGDGSSAENARAEYNSYRFVQPDEPSCAPVSVEKASWGRTKVLYR